MYERNRKLLPDRLFPFSLPSIHRIFRTQPFACTAGTFSFRAKRFVEICSSLQAIRTFCYGNLADETSTDTSHTGRKRERERAYKRLNAAVICIFREPCPWEVSFLLYPRIVRLDSHVQFAANRSSLRSPPTSKYLISAGQTLVFLFFFFFFFYDSWVLRTLHGRFVKRKIISSTELFSKV